MNYITSEVLIKNNCHKIVPYVKFESLVEGVGFKIWFRKEKDKKTCNDLYKAMIEKIKRELDPKTFII